MQVYLSNNKLKIVSNGLTETFEVIDSTQYKIAQEKANELYHGDIYVMIDFLRKYFPNVNCNLITHITSRHILRLLLGNIIPPLTKLTGDELVLINRKLGKHIVALRKI